jgi:hypothetical protein
MHLYFSNSFNRLSLYCRWHMLLCGSNWMCRYYSIEMYSLSDLTVLLHFRTFTVVRVASTDVIIWSPNWHCVVLLFCVCLLGSAYSVYFSQQSIFISSQGNSPAPPNTHTHTHIHTHRYNLCVCNITTVIAYMIWSQKIIQFTDKTKLFQLIQRFF